jgi:hypothetical protein
MSATVSYVEQPSGFRMTCTIGASTYSADLSGAFRSPYNPWVIQIRLADITTWDDGREIGDKDFRAIVEAIKAKPPGEYELVD